MRRTNELRGEVIKRVGGASQGFYYWVDIRGRDFSKTYYVLLAESSQGSSLQGEVTIYPYKDYKFILTHTSYQAENLSKVGGANPDTGTGGP